jgi:hypothetical protein
MEQGMQYESSLATHLVIKSLGSAVLHINYTVICFVWHMLVCTVWSGGERRIRCARSIAYQNLRRFESTL